ncbi:mRNA interferase MazF [Flavobacterium sp. CG_23.5]|uniref:type II toxin-antitoxin system PemK/MazF family toxin n=1 Tax=unclassified Flavobacterium TaxID=196869 RepID=UPI0018CA4C0E|nr:MULTISPECIES: type II toxin-antitoxin system PemK/MazF family toxin [unclassified Flavobacterium]MBG6111163.1 mRNA interferase MazF [Flavobacterium sp. CG_9.10]MBP2284367.1 mRNA interferase MazF [Flavobacterium sp. CG_23.5]
MELKQYQIVLVNLDPTIGSEMKKTRPSIIISPNEMNKFLQTIVIAPITSSSKTYPTRIEINHNKTKGWIVLDQIRTVDRQRIIKTVGNLNEKEIEKVKSILKETYVD